MASCTPRSGCEITRLKDTNSDGQADVFDTFADEWEVNGDYHEYCLRLQVR